MRGSSDPTGNRIAGGVFRVAHGRLVLPHGVIKKAQRTPRADLDSARRRRRDGES